MSFFFHNIIQLIGKKLDKDTNSFRPERVPIFLSVLSSSTLKLTKKNPQTKLHKDHELIGDPKILSNTKNFDVT